MIQRLRSPISLLLCVVLAMAIGGGCTVNRKLKITEVDPNLVELYLDEPTNNRLDLDNMRLYWAVQRADEPTPRTGELRLGSAGQLAGGSFLVLWEDPNHRGDPVAEAFHGVPGIKVRRDFFPGYPNGSGAHLAVAGEKFRATFLIRDKVSDGVKFGAQPRPGTRYGSVNETGSLAGSRPEGQTGITRTWNGGSPTDTDSESDWALAPATPGTR